MAGQFWSNSHIASSIFTNWLISHKIKTVLHRYEYRDLLRFNVDVAIYRALQEMSAGDLRGFYNQVGYFRM